MWHQTKGRGNDYKHVSDGVSTNERSYCISAYTILASVYLYSTDVRKLNTLTILELRQRAYMDKCVHVYMLIDPFMIPLTERPG